MGQCMLFKKRKVQRVVKVSGEVKEQGGLSAIDKKLIFELKIQTAPRLSLSNSTIHQRRKMKEDREADLGATECSELRASA